MWRLSGEKEKINLEISQLDKNNFYQAGIFSFNQYTFWERELFGFSGRESSVPFFSSLSTALKTVVSKVAKDLMVDMGGFNPRTAVLISQSFAGLSSLAFSLLRAFTTSASLWLRTLSINRPNPIGRLYHSVFTFSTPHQSLS